jgi:hypothetical protein
VTAIEIPDTVSWAECKAFVEHIGLDPKSLRSLEIGVDGVWASIFAREPGGHLVVADGDAACHRMFIPFDRGPE